MACGNDRTHTGSHWFLSLRYRCCYTMSCCLCRGTIVLTHVAAVCWSTNFLSQSMDGRIGFFSGVLYEYTVRQQAVFNIREIKGGLHNQRGHGTLFEIAAAPRVAIFCRVSHQWTLRRLLVLPRDTKRKAASRVPTWQSRSMNGPSLFHADQTNDLCAVVLIL